MRNTTLALALAIMTLADAAAFDVQSLSLHLHLAGLSRAEAPTVMEDQAVFSVKGPYRSVGAAFEHEGWAIVHAFERNAQGVFVLALPLPLDSENPLAYRIVVDGVWTRDPANPSWRRDPRTALDLSVLAVPRVSSERPGLYRLVSEDGRLVRFLWKGEPGSVVTVAGDFNQWDPFLHELRETEPGVFRLDLALPPGRHRYAFFYRGESRADPLNPSHEFTKDGMEVSTVELPAY